VSKTKFSADFISLNPFHVLPPELLVSRLLAVRELSIFIRVSNLLMNTCWSPDTIKIVVIYHVFFAVLRVVKPSDDSIAYLEKHQKTTVLVSLPPIYLGVFF
jgi:hypothetical protein